MYLRIIKRLLDLVVGIGLLILLSPLLLILMVLIRVTLGSPVIFKQIRTGLNGQLFTLYKFRTMRTIYDAKGDLLPDKFRLTTFGNFLRRWSLDELPELLNLIKGDMSFVGPRPLLPEYLPFYSSEQARRHNVKPGLTGWAQVSGRNSLSWDNRFKLDVWYVDHLSLLLDVKIIFLTFITLFKSKGITAEGHASMPKFNDQK